jgi:arylsulfatase
MGFEYFYGSWAANQPVDSWLFRDHTQIFPWKDQPGFNLITAEADEQ